MTKSHPDEPTIGVPVLEKTLRMDRRTIFRLLRDGVLPPPVNERVRGRELKWRRSDIERFVRGLLEKSIASLTEGTR